MEDTTSLRVQAIRDVFQFPQQDSEKMQRFKDAIAAQTNYTILVSKMLLCLIKNFFLPSN